MPEMTYTQSEVNDLIKQTAREVADAAANALRPLIRSEVDRASRQRLNTREAAIYLGIGKRRLLTLAEERRITFEDVGGSTGYVFNRTDLDALARELASGEKASVSASVSNGRN